MYNLNNNTTRKGRVALALACTLALPATLCVPAQAQLFHKRTTTTSTTHHSWFHRHPTATTAGAGIGAYALAKHSKHGIFHRHPILTGIGAAAVAHHYAKKHR
ncbi:MAG: hypothetical protein JWN14_3624 [Chthonomonadales bacterium]|nr:hypothetical protein [Chthonomonadales bacterium]